MSLNYLFVAGIYAIVNKVINKCYIGEARYLPSRIFRHFVELIHDRFTLSTELLKDWKNLNEGAPKKYDQFLNISYRSPPTLLFFVVGSTTILKGVEYKLIFEKAST